MTKNNNMEEKKIMKIENTQHIMWLGLKSTSTSENKEELLLLLKVITILELSNHKALITSKKYVLFQSKYFPIFFLII